MPVQPALRHHYGSVEIRKTVNLLVLNGAVIKVEMHGAKKTRAQHSNAPQMKHGIARQRPPVNQ
ncbi:hypothetical protein COT72_04310 [archaeon CG10_big_fil_rev_8_21_14_0_10_43_11]|nr:MAG: hypothetical protein COT72_04310 [archaeon CG10_big_fil_rev_8_21_14_0_10_43_11]